MYNVGKEFTQTYDLCRHVSSVHNKRKIGLSAIHKLMKKEYKENKRKSQSCSPLYCYRTDQKYKTVIQYLVNVGLMKIKTQLNKEKKVKSLRCLWLIFNVFFTLNTMPLAVFRDQFLFSNTDSHVIKWNSDSDFVVFHLITCQSVT